MGQLRMTSRLPRYGESAVVGADILARTFNEKARPSPVPDSPVKQRRGCDSAFSRRAARPSDASIPSPLKEEGAGNAG